MIGIQLAIADDVQAGDIVVPARLRCQACDERVCYIPATASTGWTLRIVPAGEAVAGLHSDVFSGIAFGTGDVPPATANREPAPAEHIAGANPIALLDQFTVLGSTGGYLRREDFLGFIRAAESGVAEKGWFGSRSSWTSGLRGARTA